MKNPITWLMDKAAGVGSNQLFLSVVVEKTPDTDVPGLITSEHCVGVASQKPIAAAFAKTAAATKGGNARAEAVPCLDSQSEYEAGQELFLIPNLKPDTRDHVRHHGLTEMKGYYAITSDAALAEKTLAELNAENGVPKTDPKQLIRVKYVR